jgi:hypothetical protein
LPFGLLAIGVMTVAVTLFAGADRRRRAACGRVVLSSC